MIPNELCEWSDSEKGNTRMVGWGLTGALQSLLFICVWGVEWKIH